MKTILALLLAVTLNLAEARDGGVSCAEAKVIVNTHNDLRKQIASGLLSGQPKAANMQKIVWDDALAKMAQNHANKKKFEHSSNRKDDRFSVGENIYTHLTSDLKEAPSQWERAVTEWFKENEKYDYKPVGEPQSGIVGHFTQVAWAETLYLGCGYSTYLDTYKGDKWRRELYVCNYGPAGNMKQKYPYKAGEGCEELCCSTQCARAKESVCKFD